MCGKIKTTIFILSCDNLLGELMSLFYSSDINVFSIDYANWELYYIVAVITSGRVIDDNLRSKIKSGTSHSYL